MLDNEITEPIDRDTALAINLINSNYENIQQQGIKAGFSPSYVRTSQFHKKLRSPQFNQLIHDIAKSYGYTTLLPMRLNHAYVALNHANNKAMEDPKNALENEAKLTHIDKLIYNLTDIKAEKPPVAQTTINIQELRVVHQGLAPELPAKAQDIVDGEVVDKGE